MNLDVDSTKLIIISGTTCVGTAAMFVARKIYQKRTRIKKLKRAVTNDLQLWDSLMSMETSEYLTNIEEMLSAFQRQTLEMSRERLRIIILTRQKQLVAEEKASKGELKETLNLMGSMMTEVKSFITENLINTEHRSLKKRTPYFNEIAIQIERVSAEPEVLLTESYDESTISFDEVHDLFTILVDSTSTPRVLRTEARRLKGELEEIWNKLRKSKNRYKHAVSDIEQWIEFAEENSDLIAEVLDTTNEWWPES